MIKIQQFRIGGICVKLVASYLTNRRQYVKINDKCTPTASVASGVPQGSIIGPLLFILFISDPPFIFKNSESFGYADDFKHVNTDPCTLQEDITRIEKWCSDSEMKLNSDKCYILPIKTKCEIDNSTLNTNRLSALGSSFWSREPRIPTGRHASPYGRSIPTGLSYASFCPKFIFNSISFLLLLIFVWFALHPKRFVD